MSEAIVTMRAILEAAGREETWDVNCPILAFLWDQDFVVASPGPGDARQLLLTPDGVELAELLGAEVPA